MRQYNRRALLGKAVNKRVFAGGDFVRAEQSSSLTWEKEKGPLIVFMNIRQTRLREGYFSF